MELCLQHIHWGLSCLLRLSRHRPDRLRQALAVHLAVGVAWNLINLHHHLRYHVIGLQCCHMLLDGLRVEGLLARDIGHDIGGAVQRVAGRLQGGACDPWAGEDCCLHLA